MTKSEELVKLKTLQGKILDVMNGAADYAEISTYTYTEADGTQSATRRSPQALMDWYYGVCKRISFLEREQRNDGLMTFGTNRYG